MGKVGRFFGAAVEALEDTAVNFTEEKVGRFFKASTGPAEGDNDNNTEAQVKSSVAATGVETGDELVNTSEVATWKAEDFFEVATNLSGDVANASEVEDLFAVEATTSVDEPANDSQVEHS